MTNQPNRRMQTNLNKNQEEIITKYIMYTNYNTKKHLLLILLFLVIKKLFLAGSCRATLL